MDTWDSLQAECCACVKCGLSESRTQVVFGTGDPSSPLMLIGEAPGQQEDLSGIPFVGPAGRLLDDLLLSVGLSRSDVYIANIVKCRPPGNRDPRPEEQEACLPWLREQVRLIRPKIIFCLGRIAACQIIRPDFKITKERGQIFHKGDFILTATYHPSALLRDPSKRPDAYFDFKQVAELLNAYK